MKIKAESQLKACRFQFMKLKASNDILCEAINIATEELEKDKFAYNFIKVNNECIGLDKCHVDGNCLHCIGLFGFKSVVEKLEKISELKGKLT